MKAFLTCALLITIMLSGCKKSSPGIGVLTTVSGTVMDDNLGVPIANAKITVFQEKYHISGEVAGYFPVNISGTAITDANGKYAITFSSSSQGDQHAIRISLDSSYSNLNNLVKVKIGGQDTMNFTAWKLSILKAHVIVKNNPGPNVLVTAGFNTSSAVVYGANKDTTVSFQVAPNRVNGLTFGIQVPGNTYPSYLVKTVTFTGDSAIYHQTFTVYPSTFVEL
jgi:hypothetical protein